VLLLQIYTTTQEFLAKAVVAAVVQRHSFAPTRTATLGPVVNTLLALGYKPAPDVVRPAPMKRCSTTPAP
jgi:hypothetical protein